VICRISDPIAVEGCELVHGRLFAELRSREGRAR
jgi:hypothetical protein